MQDATDEQPDPPAEPEHVDAAPAPRRRWMSGVELPDVPLWVGAAATGIAAGLAAVILVSLGLLGCNAVRGAPSCGGAGYPLLLLILVLVGTGAAVLLRLVGVASAGATAFIGVCLVLVVVLAFLVEAAFSYWMWAIMPTLGAVCFVAAAYLVRAGESTEQAAR